jgi:hypothetical protein
MAASRPGTGWFGGFGTGRTGARDLKGKMSMAVHDIDKARSTYESFMGALKWVVPLIAVVTLVVVSLIAP